VDLPHQLFRRCTVLLRIESGGGYVLSHKPVSSPVQPAQEAHFPSAQGTLAIDQDLERPSVHSHSPNSATVLSSTNLKIHDKFKPSPQAGHFAPGYQCLDRTLPSSEASLCIFSADRPTAVTVLPCAASCRHNSDPMPPDAPNTTQHCREIAFDESKVSAILPPPL
jgi:hypothetical protein